MGLYGIAAGASHPAGACIPILPSLSPNPHMPVQNARPCAPTTHALPTVSALCVRAERTACLITVPFLTLAMERCSGRRSTRDMSVNCGEGEGTWRMVSMWLI